MNNIYFILFFFATLELHTMEQQIIKEKSSIQSLKLLAAKACAQQYKKLPDNPIPTECLDPIKLYLLVTLDSVVEQYALSLKFNDEKRKKESQDQLIQSYTSWKKNFWILMKDPGLEDFFEKCKSNVKLDLKTKITLSSHNPEIKKLYNHLEASCSQSSAKFRNYTINITLISAIFVTIFMLPFLPK